MSNWLEHSVQVEVEAPIDLVLEFMVRSGANAALDEMDRCGHRTKR